MFQHLRIALPMLLLAGCGGSSSSSPSTPSSPTAPTATVSSIAVSGNSPAVGETSQFTATATLSTGTTQDVTAQATWQSSDAAVATVSSAGVVRSVASGDADITATYSGVRGSQHVRVAAALVTRTLTGIITDDSTGRPIVEQAEAQIMDGENAGRSGRVDADGRYSIADIAAGTFMLRARATGYESRDHQVTMDTSDVRVDFALRAQRRDVPCSYTVTPGVLWISLGGLANERIQVTTSRPGCPWTATAPDRIFIGGLNHVISRDETSSFTVATHPVVSRACVWTFIVQVRWNGGGSDVILKQPIAFPDPPPCK